MEPTETALDAFCSIRSISSGFRADNRRVGRNNVSRVALNKRKGGSRSAVCGAHEEELSACFRHLDVLDAPRACSQ